MRYKLLGRSGLRVSELVHLRWDQVDLDQGFLHVRRLKHGVPSTHPLTGSEIRALRRLAKQAPDQAYVFLSERQGPLTASTCPSNCPMQQRPQRSWKRSWPPRMGGPS